MPDRETFDGTVPFVVKMPPFLGPRRWAAFRMDDRERSKRFATWREAMKYATKEDHR